MAGQHTAVNTFPGLVHTARHTMRVGNAVEGRVNDWGEVVTRQPYQKVRLDHLLSKEKEEKRVIEIDIVLLFIFQCTFLVH